MLSAVSLFSGAGGMDAGFHAAGFDIEWANDINADACATYRANHGSVIHEGDVRGCFSALQGFRGVDLLFGGPPCQGFSVAGKMDSDDPRSQLIWSFLDAVETIRPRAFVCENVKALALLDRWRRVREGLFARTASLGYHYELVILKASDYGVPQNRERMFLIGFQDPLDPRMLVPALKRKRAAAPTLRDVIIPLGRAGSAANNRICRAKVTAAAKPVLRKSPYAGMLFNGQGRPLDPDGYASTLPASMGGNRTPIIDEDHLFDDAPSWVEDYHRHLMTGGDPLSMHAVPARLRRLTVDEALRLQCFPPSYQFHGKQTSVFSQIGNAVPPRLAQAVAEVVKGVLTHQMPEHGEEPVQAELPLAS